MAETDMVEVDVNESSAFRSSMSRALRNKPLAELIAFVEKTAQQLQENMRDGHRNGTLKRANSKAKHHHEKSSSGGHSRTSQERRALRESRRIHNDDIWTAIGNFFRRRPHGRSRTGSNGSLEPHPEPELPTAEESPELTATSNLKRAESSHELELDRKGSDESEDARQHIVPKYATLRPGKNLEQGAAGGHAGQIRLRSQIYIQGGKINSWHKCWFNLWYTGLELYMSETESEKQVGGFQDIFFKDLVLPTGKVVEILPKKNWGAENRFPFCINTEHEMFVFAADSKDKLHKIASAIDLAYAEFIERKIRKKAMMQIVWALSDDPEKLLDSKHFPIVPGAARPTHHGARFSLFRNRKQKSSRSHQSHVDEQHTQNVLTEMIDALDEKFEIELDRVLLRRAIYRAFFGWKTVVKYRKNREEW